MCDPTVATSKQRISNLVLFTLYPPLGTSKEVVTGILGDFYGSQFRPMMVDLSKGGGPIKLILSADHEGISNHNTNLSLPTFQ